MVHNVWFQQFGNCGAYLYATTFNDYVWAFKQLTLYHKFKKGGHSKQGPNMSELLLHWT